MTGDAVQGLAGAETPRELIELGWSSVTAAGWAAGAEPGLQPGRVTTEERGVVHVATATGPVVATLAGRLRHASEQDLDVLLPAVGDWVGLADAGPGTGVVQVVLPRASAIIRRSPYGRSSSRTAPTSAVPMPLPRTEGSTYTSHSQAKVARSVMIRA